MAGLESAPINPAASTAYEKTPRPAAQENTAQAGAIIRNNIIMRCTDAGIYINKGHNCRIYNNTVFECELTIQLRYVESTGYVRNNLVKPSPTNSGEPIIRLRDGVIESDVAVKNPRNSKDQFVK